jgi:hypothetical protein
LALTQQRAGIRSPFDVPIFMHLILFQDYYAIPIFLGILAAAFLPPARALGAALAAWCARNVLALGAVTAALLAAGTHAVFHLHALSLDEHTVLFQSEVFAAGRLTGQFPPDLVDWLVPAFFQERFLRPSYETGQVASVYWPGFSLLLTPFTALGASWLLNPLIGAATVVVMHRLALELLGDRLGAGYAALLTLASPAVTLNAASYYAMPAHLLANAVFMLLLLRATPLRCLAAGAVGSLALVLHNPVPHLLFALPWIVWLALRPERWRVVGALAAGYLPLSVALGWGWAMFLDGLAPVSDGTGLLARRLSGVLAWTSSSGMAAHLFDLGKLWLWAVPGLLIAAALGAWGMRRQRGPWLVLACSALHTYFGYFLVSFDQGHGWGFRYFHSAWLALPLFAAAAIRQSAGLGAYLAASAVLSLAVLTPFQALQVERFVARHLMQLPVAARGEPRVVFIDRAGGYYNWDLVQNDAFLRAPVIRLLARDPQLDRAMMAKRFPEYELLSADRRGAVWGLPPR